MNLTSTFANVRLPGYHRSMLLRRILAVCLLCAAGISMLLDARSSDPAAVVFAKDVAPGAVLTAEDVTVRRLPAAVLPEKAISDPEAVIGQILGAAGAAGEIITSSRVVGPDMSETLLQELSEEENPSEYTMVPVSLTEPELLPMLHHGASVDIVAQGPRIIATGGKVVTTSEDGIVLVLLHATQAAEVAAASLTEPLTVVLNTSIVLPIVR